MSENYSIKISDFQGIFHAIAEKANINGGSTLESVEINIFNDINKTHNLKNNTFIFENEIYDKYGNIIEDLNIGIPEPAISTSVNHTKVPDEILLQQKNDIALENAKRYAKEMENNYNKTINIDKVVNGKHVSFSYNQKAIEDYVINSSLGANGKKITYFTDIPAIKMKPFGIRTKEECKKLNEFNNMINSAISTGVEYGVDPKLIVAIMQREVGYEGLSDKVVGKNGKGYMQITSIPIKDMLGIYTKNGKQKYLDKIKTNIYGPELIELLKSRGFDPDCKKEERGTLANEIINYLKENKDPDFNIRIGTLILRQCLNKSKGNVQIAAQNYNGNGKNGIKYSYGKAVKKYYNTLNTIQNNSTNTT